MTTTVEPQKIKLHAPLSEYAKFHISFTGKSFLNTRTNKIKKKLSMFHSLSKRQREQMIDGQFLPPNYIIVDSPGWKNGNLLPTSKPEKF